MDLREFILKRKYVLTLLLCVISYTIIFTYFTYQKHISFNSFAWDLGIFDQVFYSTIFGGRPFYYTPELYLNPTGNYLAIHFSPILLLLLPLYALFPSVWTLLFSKCLILSLAAFPLFYISRNLTGDERTSLFVSTAYLLNPGLHGANWFDFQPQIFIPLLAFTTYLLLIEERWPLYIASFLLTLAIQEHVFSIMIALLLGHLSYSVTRKPNESLKTQGLSKVAVPLISIALCPVYYYISKTYMGRFPITPEFLPVYKATNVFAQIGFTGDTFSLPLYVLSHPGRSFKALTYDLFPKFLYGLFLFAPLLFLPLMSRFTAFNLIILAPFLLSNYRAYYMVGSHYSLYLLPLMFVSLMYTLRSKTGEGEVRLAKYVLAASSLMIMVLSPLSPLSSALNEAGDILWYPKPQGLTNRIKWTHGMIDSIPGEASVLTQNHLFPHVSERIHAYVLPPPDFNADQILFLEEYVTSLINRSKYILLDLKAMDRWTLYTHKTITSDSEFAIQAFSEMVILFERGGEADTMITDPDRKVYRANEDMHIGFGDVVRDSPTEGGAAVLSPRGSGKGYFIYGPYSYLMDYAYDVSFGMKSTEPGEGYIATFEVTSDEGEHLITKRDIYGHELEGDRWRIFALKIGLDRPRELVEYRFYTVGAADVLVDFVEVNKVVGPSYPALTRAFNHMDLYTKDASLTAGGLIYHNGSTSTNIIWYGPYHTLPKGEYTATFFLKIDPYDPKASEPIITLDVAHGEGKYTLTSREIFYEEFVVEDSSSGWSALTLDFVVEAQDAVVEFRGLNPTPGYDIYLSQIIIEPASS